MQYILYTLCILSVHTVTTVQSVHTVCTVCTVCTVHTVRTLCTVRTVPYHTVSYRPSMGEDVANYRFMTLAAVFVSTGFGPIYHAGLNSYRFVAAEPNHNLSDWTCC